MSYVFVGDSDPNKVYRDYEEAREKAQKAAEKERDDKDLFKGMTLGGIGLTSIVLWYLIDKKIY